MRQRAATRSLAQQAFDLRRRFPNGKVDPRRARLVWTGTIQPSPLSREYRVRVTYRWDHTPEVRVLDPLEGRSGESLPHVFGDGTLCLHLPGEWTPGMFIADSTLTWTAEWLFNYEIWKATGEWHGGGEWPPVRPAEENSDTTMPGEAASPIGTAS